MRVLSVTLTAVGLGLVAKAPGALALDGILPYPLEFHFVNGPHGYMVCPKGEFKCGTGCCHNVSH